MLAKKNNPMNDTADLSAISDIARKIKDLEANAETGSYYLITGSGDKAVVVMDAGVVVDVIYKNVRGTSALPLFRRIGAAKGFFERGLTDEVKAAIEKGAKLSYNEILFRMFGLEHKHSAAAYNSPMISSMAGKKVLVVEDSRVSRIVLCTFLGEHGYEVLEAGNGRTALSQLALETPDLVILDLILPDIDGYEIFHQMKADERLRKIPVLILTSRDSLVDRLRGKMSGSDEYITKPFKNEVLLQKLEKYLG